MLLRRVELWIIELPQLGGVLKVKPLMEAESVKSILMRLLLSILKSLVCSQL